MADARRGGEIHRIESKVVAANGFVDASVAAVDVVNRTSVASVVDVDTSTAYAVDMIESTQDST